MGRWMSRLQTAEKNTETASAPTLKRVETPSEEVLNLLKVPSGGVCEKFSATAEPAAPPPMQPDPPASRPGITITAMPIEVSWREYDAHLDALIEAAGPGTVEANVLRMKKRHGVVVARGAELIFTRGR